MSSKEYQSKRRAANPELARQVCRDAYLKLRLALLDRLGGRCKKCGFSDWRALQVDHVQGGGNLQIRDTNKNGYQRLLLILNEVDSGSQNYQILCANCNQIKRWEQPIERTGVGKGKKK